MMEWKSKYNSFNSDKGLTYYENYKNILAWMDGKAELGPPIEASLDPINTCNNNCYYCNSQRYLREQPAHLGRWGREYMEDILIHLAAWGVQGFCWGGGGESTLNIRLPEMTKFGTDLGMECAVITNGVHMPAEMVEALLLCRWVGISLDSADPEAYKKIRGTDDCEKVLGNISKLVAGRTKTDLCVKVLVLPETIDSIVYTCQVAKDLGVQDFHIRPVDLERKDNQNPQKLKLNMEQVKSVFAQCHEMEDENFRVYTVTHKYDDEFHIKHDFDKCLASPLVTQICTDKKAYVCVDHRLEPRFEVKGWGSDEHRELLKYIDPHTECARCTWAEYNKQVTAVKNDSMCRSFP